MSTTKITSADEAQRMLDDGRWDYDDSAADCARSVIDLHRQVDTARAVAANIERERHALRAAYDRDVARLSSIVEQHEERAREHSDERAGHHGEMARVTAERDTLREQFCTHLEQLDTLLDVNASVTDLLTADLSTAHCEIARLRAALAEAHAIIEGRTIAPTDAEIVAHWRAGGTWIVEGVIVLRVVEAVCAHRDQASWAAVTWLPLDRSRRPCAWPVVEARHG